MTGRPKAGSDGAHTDRLGRDPQMRAYLMLPLDADGAVRPEYRTEAARLRKIIRARPTAKYNGIVS